MIDYNSLLYDPVYRAKGASATLGSGAQVTIIDDTNGTTIEGQLGIETIGPSCRVRMAELISNNISTTALTGDSIEFNGASWRIKTFRMMPNANGENDGQVRLMLLSEG